VTTTVNDNDEVEWEVARELKTVNWDRLKEIMREETVSPGSSTRENSYNAMNNTGGAFITNGVEYSGGYTASRSPTGRSKSSPVCYFENRINDYHHVNFEDGISCDRGITNVAGRSGGSMVESSAVVRDVKGALQQQNPRHDESIKKKILHF
jgi:hypothetical protein